jgi:hypothetical protein
MRPHWLLVAAWASGAGNHPAGIASLNDIAVRTIPNLAPFGLVVIGVASRLAHGATAALASAVFSVSCAGGSGWLGGGDVKLLAACAGWCRRFICRSSCCSHGGRRRHLACLSRPELGGSGLAR